MPGLSFFLCVPLCTTTDFLKAWWLGSEKHSERKIHSRQDPVRPLYVSCLLESEQEKNRWEHRPGEGEGVKIGRWPTYSMGT